MKDARKLLFVIIIAFAHVCFSSAQKNTYFAQTAAGSATGVNCAEAKVYGANQTGTAGNTITLCGTFTAAITLNGSGISGSPITLAFDCASSAQISMAAIPAIGGLTITGNYVTIDGKGCGFTDGTHASSGQKFGQIASTNNGQSGFGNSVGSQAIIANSITNLTVQNFSCGPLYLHNTTAQTSWGAPYPVCINFTGTNSVTTINNNFFTDCAWCAWGNGNTTTFSNNYVQNFDHGLGMGDTATGTNFGPVYFFGNSLTHATTWDTGGAGQYHHDGIHLWAYSATDTYDPTIYAHDVYIYNNRFFGNWGAINTTAFVFFEMNVHNSFLFNNAFDCSYSGNECDSGLIAIQGSNVSHIWNNTFLGSGTAQVTPIILVGGPSVSDQNNVISTVSPYLLNITAKDQGGSNNTTIAALSNNIYMNSGANPWVYFGSYYSTYSSYVAASSETSGVYSASNTVNSGTLTLQNGSPAIGAGANLTSTCNGQPNPGLGALCRDANGNLRPSSGAWDPGAFSSKITTAPSAPSSLKVVVH